MYKKQLEIARRMEVFQGIAFDLPAFPSGSKALSIEVSDPVEEVNDIKYTAEDDKVLEQWIREHVNSIWHPMATCKMAPKENNGVVNPTLGVYGIQGLKIADISISPSNIGCNICNTSLAIAEKAADIFIQELGLGKH